MPFYDLRCKHCGREFNFYATISERRENQIPCPDCGGAEHATVLKDGAAIIVNRDDKCPTGGCCPGCSHAH